MQRRASAGGARRNLSFEARRKRRCADSTACTQLAFQLALQRKERRACPVTGVWRTFLCCESPGTPAVVVGCPEAVWCPRSSAGRTRLCMSVYVLMIVCVSYARESNFSRPRWSGRRQCCSPGCLPTPHENAGPSRARQQSSVRSCPRSVLDDRVRFYLRVYLRFCLRVKNRTPDRHENCCK